MAGTGVLLAGRLPILVLLLAALTGACREPAAPESDLALAWDVSPRPVAAEPADVTLTLSDSLGRPVSGADLQVEATMTHPGMQPVHAAAREVAPGRYVASLRFTMAGDWVLLVHGDLPDGRVVDRQLNLNVDAAP